MKMTSSPEIIPIILMRYFLEAITKIAIEQCEGVEENKEFLEMMKSAKTGLITIEQAEYAGMFYSLQHEDLKKDITEMSKKMIALISSSMKGTPNGQDT